MRKVFRHLGPWMAVGLFAAFGEGSTTIAAAPNANSGPMLSPPAVEGATATPAARRTPRASTRSSSVRSTDQWKAAASRDSRFASPSEPTEPAFSQAVANSWRRSARASVRQPARSSAPAATTAIQLKVATPAPNPIEVAAPASEAASPEPAIAQLSSSDPLTPSSDNMPALTAPTNAPAESRAKVAIAVAVASPRTHTPPPATSPVTSAHVVSRPAATSPPAAARQPVAMGQPAATREPLAMSRPAVMRAAASSPTVSSPREPIAAAPAPLAERQGLLGFRAARLRSALQIGRADVQPAAGAANESRPGFAGVRQTAGFEGTVIRDVPAAEAEAIPTPDSADSSTGLAQSTTSECSECGDDSCDDCCTECPRRRPLLALIDKLDECKAKCCACCNQESWNNCNCNGSYKFPVPPLYTYHWPGLYSAELMTDYHSPWRFPPLKPYTDEVPRAGEGPPQPLSMVVPTSHQQPGAAPAGEQPAKKAAEPVAESRIVGEPEPLSKKLCREYGMQE